MVRIEALRPVQTVDEWWMKEREGVRNYTLQEHQRIRTNAIYQTFLTLKFVLWAMEIFTFSSIQPM